MFQTLFKQAGRWMAMAAVCAALSPVAAQAQAGAVALDDAEHARWPAIGRVNMAGFSRTTMCNGTLIAPDLVLTAAHCVPPKAQVDLINQDVVHFVAGWNNGEFVAHRKVARILFHPDVALAGPQGSKAIAADVALLQLESAIPADEVQPLPLTPLSEKAADLAILAYGSDRPNMLSRRSTCAVTLHAPNAIGLDCPVAPGNSGAPVLRRIDGQWHVVAVLTAAAVAGDTSASYAAIPDAPIRDVVLAAQLSR